MCFWKKPQPDPMPEGVGNLVLRFAINNYPGSSSDLNGCINDLKDVKTFISAVFPGKFTYEEFKDSEVTRQKFRDEVKNHILAAVSGDKILIHYSGHGTYGYDADHDEADGYDEALYLYDGPFWDDEFRLILDLIPDGVDVIIALDSCFSFGATKNSPKYIKNKFVKIQDIKPNAKKRKSILRGDDVNYVLYSGCQERQTSADAYINGRYNGAFTYYWLRALSDTKTYMQWGTDTQALIKATKEYEQIPGILMGERFKNKAIFT